jgi:hypothetical protein
MHDLSCVNGQGFVDHRQNLERLPSEPHCHTTTAISGNLDGCRPKPNDVGGGTLLPAFLLGFAHGKSKVGTETRQASRKE